MAGFLGVDGVNARVIVDLVLSAACDDATDVFQEKAPVWETASITGNLGYWESEVRHFNSLALTFLMFCAAQ